MNGLALFAGVSALFNVGVLASRHALTSSRAQMQLRGGSNSSPEHPQTLNPHILITGGAGYIGTHTIVCLLQAGYDVTVVDNLVNANEESLRRVRAITECHPSRLRFYKADMLDKDELEEVFRTSPTFTACIHFAGLKAVGESVRKPLLYYENNLISTFNLLKLMGKYDCTSIVFSSSATVYGSAAVPITEATQTGVGITNPYGRTKYMIEEILKDFKLANPEWSVVILRYFNPVGSHPSGLIGEDPNGIPNNLMPFVSQVAVGRRPHVTVFGNDWPTPDGTGVRDYIHVMDLSEGHVAALKYVAAPSSPSSTAPAAASAGFRKYSVFNLGTGHGESVLDMVKAMENASGKKLPVEFGPRREGDIATCYADPAAAKAQLGWVATRSLADMCADLWRWQSSNPNGYSK